MQTRSYEFYEVRTDMSCPSMGLNHTVYHGSLESCNHWVKRETRTGKETFYVVRCNVVYKVKPDEDH